MNFNFDTKYKARTPEDTISIIKNFFEGRGYTLTEVTFQTEAGTWTVHIELFDKGFYILQSNGKGMTKLFSLASGYAELYERYCNMHPILSNKIFQKRFFNNNFGKNGFYFQKGEKEISYTEMFQSNPEIKDFFYKILKTPQNVQRFFEESFNNKFIGVPFVSTKNDSDIIYIDPRISALTWTSIGLAAGNSIEEALTQGLSEICERIGLVNFYFKPQERFYAIDLTKIKNKDLKDKIDKINKAGYLFYVIDLSYNFNVPTLMSILIDPISLLTSVDFGSYPVFDIAFERVITEIYQGVATFKNKEINIQTPYSPNGAIGFLNSALNNISEANSIDENFFSKVTFVESYNKKIFLEEATDFSSLIKYLNNIFDNLGYKCYYADMSLSKDIAAIRINVPGLYLMNEKIELLSKASPLIVGDCLDIIKDINNNMDKLLSLNENVTLDELKEIYQCFYKISDKQESMPPITGAIIGTLLFSNPYMVFGQSNSNIIHSLKNWPNVFLFEYKHSYWMPDLKKYLTLVRYKQNKYYSKEQIINFFAALGSYISEEDYDNALNSDYIFSQIFINGTLKLYYSSFYNELIQKFLY